MDTLSEDTLSEDMCDETLTALLQGVGLGDWVKSQTKKKSNKKKNRVLGVVSNSSKIQKNDVVSKSRDKCLELVIDFDALTEAWIQGDKWSREVNYWDRKQYLGFKEHCITRVEYDELISKDV